MYYLNIFCIMFPTYEYGFYNFRHYKMEAKALRIKFLKNLLKLTTDKLDALAPEYHQVDIVLLFIIIKRTLLF